jgi:hypothetical protein
MSQAIGLAILFCSTLPLFGWQEPSAKPNFSGAWQLDAAKSKTTAKDDLVWKINQNLSDIAIEEVSAGKTLSSAKCTMGKSCDFEESGNKMTAMTYFLDTVLVQMRSAADNSTVIKRHLKLDEDGSLRVEVITIVPRDAKDVLVFTKQKPTTAGVKAAVVNATK